jgi:hypothetical protein
MGELDFAPNLWYNFVEDIHKMTGELRFEGFVVGSSFADRLVCPFLEPFVQSIGDDCKNRQVENE